LIPPDVRRAEIGLLSEESDLEEVGYAEEVLPKSRVAFVVFAAKRIGKSQARYSTPKASSLSLFSFRRAFSSFFNSSWCIVFFLYFNY